MVTGLLFSTVLQVEFFVFRAVRYGGSGKSRSFRLTRGAYTWAACSYVKVLVLVFPDLPLGTEILQ